MTQTQPEAERLVLVAGETSAPWVIPLLEQLGKTEETKLVFAQHIGLIAQAMFLYPDLYGVVIDPYTSVPQSQQTPDNAWGIPAVKKYLGDQRARAVAPAAETRVVMVSDRLSHAQEAEVMFTVGISGIVLASQPVEKVIKQVMILLELDQPEDTDLGSEEPIVATETASEVSAAALDQEALKNAQTKLEKYLWIHPVTKLNVQGVAFDQEGLVVTVTQAISNEDQVHYPKVQDGFSIRYTVDTQFTAQ